ncbi:hypothetical protein ACFX2A_014628 [Malus domestica]
MTFQTPLQNFSLKPKRANLYYMMVAAVLCTICYLVGIWQHSTSRAVINIPVSVIASCPPITTNTTITFDFNAHHRTDDLPLPPVAACVAHLLACDAKHSEYTPCENVTRSLKFDIDKLVYRERHCPDNEKLLQCRIPTPYGYTFRFPGGGTMFPRGTDTYIDDIGKLINLGDGSI